jgi:hypothetical protein
MPEHEQDDQEREFDLRWADQAEHKEPSARNGTGSGGFSFQRAASIRARADPEHVARRSRRSGWVSTAIVLGCVAGVIVLLGYINFRTY